MTHSITGQTVRAWPRARTTGLRPPHLDRRRAAVLVFAFAALLALSTVASTFLHLRTPDPTGIHAVGKEAQLLEDASRAEVATETPGDRRQVRVVAWYPAVAGTGEPAAYLDGLDRIGDGLVASGAIDAFARAGLDWVSTSARHRATVAGTDEAYPVVILSPGNATNVEFYGALAEELASHGYVVIGLDHPYQSAAVAIGDSVVTYAGDAPMAQAEAVTRARIDERVADIGFVLDRLEADAAGFAMLDARLDLGRVAVIGHSNGGLAAVQICDDPRVRACANLDGQNAAGPFGTGTEPVAPANPFLFLTKDAELHPALVQAFEEGGAGGYRVVVPAAAHDSFTDGPRFQPRILPLEGTADAVLTVTRGFLVAFLEHVLGDEPRSVLGDVHAPTDVLVEVYPLQPGADGAFRWRGADAAIGGGHGERLPARVPIGG